MRKVIVLALVLMFTIFYASVTWGSAAVGFGARAVGMGGAFTAVADDGSAPYWNPAGITQIKYVVFTPAFGAEGKYDKADSLIDTSSGLPKLSKNDLQLSVLSYLGFTTKYVGLNGFIDLNATATTTNGNSMDAKAVSYGYGALTLAGNFGDQWAVGINVKTIQATTVVSHEDISQTGHKSTATGDGMAFDIGILYFLNDQTRLGFMGRNIVGKVNWSNGKTIQYSNNIENGPETTYNPTDNLSKSYVLGIAYNPYETLTLAADAEMIDATDNANDQTRFHIGVEQRTLWDTVTVRLGACTNKDEKDSLTGGLGFKIGPVLLDTAYVSADQNVGYYLTLGVKF